MIFSLSDKSIPRDTLKAAFDARLTLESGFDSTVDMFDRAFARLQQTIMKTNIVNGQVFVSLANPSINDYCATSLSRNNAECVSIVRTAVFVDQFERITKVNQCPNVISAVRNIFATRKIFELPFASGASKSVAIPGFKIVLNCEPRLNESDFAWMASFLQSTLESPNRRSWEEASSFLFDLPHQTRISAPALISLLICSVPLLENLTTGTPYRRATSLLEMVSNAASRYSCPNSDALLNVVYSHDKEWLAEFAYDFVDDWVTDNCSQDSYIPTSGFADEEEWDDFVRNDIKESINLNIGENIIKQAFPEHVSEVLADHLDDSDYKYALENAIDNCIWGLTIPQYLDDDDPMPSLNSNTGISGEVAIVEGMFSGYSLD